MNALGRHLLVELNDCDREVINDLDLIRDAMLEAAIKSGAVILGESFHRFSPQGVSGVVVIRPRLLGFGLTTAHTSQAG